VATRDHRGEKELSETVALPRTFSSRYGVPLLRRVSLDIFTTRYFTHCLQCGFCRDQCCQHGVDVDLRALAGIRRHAPGLEAFTGIPRNGWFEDEIERDQNSPGGGAVRTRVRDGRCVFLNRQGRGCLIHAYCLERGLDYHDLKPLVDCLFPLTYEDDALVPACEVEDGSLICLNTGPTLYRGARSELAYYFGEDLVEVLDTLERHQPSAAHRPG
jgi:hypothetical protein